MKLTSMISTAVVCLFTLGATTAMAAPVSTSGLSAAPTGLVQLASHKHHGKVKKVVVIHKHHHHHKHHKHHKKHH